MTRTATAIVVVLALGAAPAARADRIHLRGGGEISGVVLDDPEQPDRVVVQTEGSARPLVLDKGQVVRVTPVPGPLDEYVAGRDGVEPTAQAQYDFALWCEESKLPGPAQIHYQKAVAIDPNFGPAHKKLGHVRQASRWVTYDQQREAQGLIKHKGRWISQAEKRRLDAQAATSSEQASWASRIKLLRAKLFGPDQAGRDQAEAQLAAIRDPAAVPGLARAFSADGDAMRVRLAQVLAGIDGPEATGALVALVGAEADPDVRQTMLDELARRRDPEATPGLLALLKTKDPEVVGRAAWALARLRAVSAVPKLVDALTQSEKRMVMAPVAARSGGGGIGGSYGFAQNLSAGANLPAGVPPGFAVVGSQPILTGPVVSDGVVAFGGGSIPVPLGNSPVPDAGSTPIRAMPRRVTIVHRNAEVLKALEALTGVNYGFDKPAWKTWVQTSFRPEAEPSRRVPQP